MKNHKTTNFTVQVEIVYPGRFKTSFTREYPLNTDHNIILEDIFDQWNAGSSRECQEFIDSNQRSLSVNDFVTIDGIPYRCNALGWKQLPKNYISELDALINKFVSEMVPNKQ